MTSAASVTQSLGGRWHPAGGYGVARCPAHDDATPSLYLRDGKSGLIAKCMAGCDWRAVRDELRRRGILEDHPTTPHSAPRVNTHRPGADQTRAAWRDLWSEAEEPRGTLVETYLAGRSLVLVNDIANRVVRFHPACPTRDGAGQLFRRPAMITAFRALGDDRLTAVHRTFLAPDGTKIERKMLGPVAGAAIKIDADECVEQGLTIGEGFETCLAARQIGLRPVWALGSVSAITSFPVLSGIESLTILAETGEPSERAVHACGLRWTQAGREVLTARPVVGDDVNTALRGVA